MTDMVENDGRTKSPSALNRAVAFLRSIFAPRVRIGLVPIVIAILGFVGNAETALSLPNATARVWGWIETPYAF